MTPQLLRVTAAVLVLASAAACGDSGAEPAFRRCPATTTLSVTAGETPEFSWAPDCAVTMLWVAPWPEGAPEPRAADGIFNVWSDTESLRPPVRYGVVPAGAGTQVDGPPRPLVAGARYRVWIAHQISHGGVITGAAFTP